MEKARQISVLLCFCLLLLAPLVNGMTADGFANSAAVVDVGLILDLETWVGKMSKTCISMALSDFYAAGNHTTRLVLHVRDSKKDIVGASAQALDLLNNVGVKAIIGPETTAQAEFVAYLGEKARVPILSFSATSPFLSSTRIPYFIRTAQDDSSQVKAIAAIVRAFEWRNVVPIYEDTYYGHGILPFLTDALQQDGVQVPYRSVISASASNNQILKELYKLNTMPTRVFVVHMCFSELGSRFFSRVKDAGMMSEGYVWITTDGITDFLGVMNSSIIHSMEGVLGVKSYVPQSEIVDSFRSRWRKQIMSEYPTLEKAELSIFGLWAYDTFQALAKATEQLGGLKSHFVKAKKVKTSTGIASLGVSSMGRKLLHAILNTQFEGLSGKFRLIDAQLQPSMFEIINVVGKGGRRIGYWAPASGLTNKTTTKTPACKQDLHVLWPGKSKELPRGWVIPTSQSRLRIGLPVDSGFDDILKVRPRKGSKRYVDPTGFVIDVFNAAKELLPYPITYDFLPLGNGGPYDDLIYKVHLQEYDAMVADTTITANRSKYADFTVSFTEAGLSMIVPIKPDKRKNEWIFLNPLSRNLWMTSAAAFAFTGFVVWALEHRINEDFRGPPAQQMGVMLWFSFSTLVFAHKEKVVSNLSRFVVIIWMFVVLILQSSYTANLASMLTVQQLKPTIESVDDLIKNGDFVGYKKDSFVLGLLKEMKFNESKLKPYLTPEEYHQALSTGSSNGGVAAIIDELPYIKLVLGKYCGQYTMVGPTIKTAGFGFVFSRGSPLVRDFSQAILEVREGKMGEIERRWFPNGDQPNCLKPSVSLESNSLTLDSFGGLFIITAAASALALLISTISFLRRNRHVLTNPGDPRTSFWHRTVDLLKHFDYKDLSYHTFKKAQEPSLKRLSVDPACNEAVSPLRNGGLQSPCSLSNGTDDVGEEGGTLSQEIENPDANTSTDGEMVVEMTENGN